MKRKAVTALTIGITLITSLPALNVYANEVQVSSKCSTEIFDIYNHKNFKAYSDKYKISKSDILLTRSNSGITNNNKVDYATDDIMSTYWETDIANYGDWRNSIEVTLKEITEIDRIVYGAREGDAKGFAHVFEIYASTEETGNNFELITTGGHRQVGDLIEARFKPTKFKRVKFVLKNSENGWGTIRELWMFKEDKTNTKINNLISEEGKLNPDYNTKSKLRTLEKEVALHPLADTFKVKIDNAKTVLAEESIISSRCSAKSFILGDNLEYKTRFGMSLNNIKSITNNGGDYGGQTIDRAIDGDINTYWETGRGNNSSWKNSVEIELKNNTILNRIIYGARNSDSKGFANEFEIYGTATEEGNTYKLITTSNHETVGGLVEAQFKPIELKRIKLVFKNSNQDWATLSELGFYKEDKLTDEINSLFTDGTQSKVKNKYTTFTLNALTKKTMGHPLEKQLKETINHAKDVIANSKKYQSQVLDISSGGNTQELTAERGLWHFKNWEPTGIAVKGGDTVEVFVDVEEGEPTPKIVYKQMDVTGNGDYNLDLIQGKNIIKIPEKTEDKRPGTVEGGVLYTSNPYSRKQQSRNPKLRIKGGFNYPIHIEGKTSNEETMEVLNDYVEKLDNDPTLPDVFEVFGEKTLNNVRATFALDFYNKNKDFTPSITAQKQDEVIEEAVKYWGFDSSSLINQMPAFRYVSMLKDLDDGGYMNAGNGVSGLNQGEQHMLLDVETSWGPLHEIGHNFDLNKLSIGEVTNNMLPQHYLKKEGKPSRITEDKVWENTIFPKVTKEDFSNNESYPEGDSYNLSHLAPLWQLSLIKEDFHAEFQKGVRVDTGSYTDNESKHNGWARISSDVMKLDLTEFLLRHGWDLTEETKHYMNKYNEPRTKIWYMNDNSYMKNGGEFTQVLDVKVVSVKETESGNRLTIKIDKVNDKNLMGYEILRDGKLIGFTNTESFTDKTSVAVEDYTYSVIAYDKELQSSKEIQVESKSPLISGGVYTVKLGEEINPLDYIVAVDNKGNNISSRCSVVSGKIDTAKRGTYKLEYEIEDNGIKKTDTSLITVVSDLNYLSDIKEVSSKVGWGALQKDTAPNETKIELQRENVTIPYTKGIGAHASSEVVYNLEGKDYERFEAVLGIDSSMIDNNGSATFEIYVDGKRVMDTGIMTPRTDGQLVSVDIKDAKELKLITTDANQNSNHADQTVWADAKLIVNSNKPTLENVQDRIVKVSSDFNLLEGIVAKDIEDSDISSRCSVEGNFDINTPGVYNITYSVTDSDGNTTTKSANITVYSVEEFASDLDFKINKEAWGGIQKDLSPAGDEISLPSSGGEVLFRRGIGACANSELVFNIEGKNYVGFKSILGIDNHERGNRNVSAKYIIEIDGKRVYESDIFGHNTNLKDISVLIPEGAKEVKLITDQADHIDWGDQTIWANAMFVSK